MITTARIQHLYDRYLELVLLETIEFGFKPTEVRHLIGRLGEFYCALQVHGTLAHLANQQGFDVVCNKGRRISVKTTAQISGFVAIGKSTISQVDDLMLLQYRDGQLSTIYYGPVGTAVLACRYYGPSGKHELDIAKARKLMAALPLTLDAQFLRTVFCDAFIFSLQPHSYLEQHPELTGEQQNLALQIHASNLYPKEMAKIVKLIDSLSTTFLWQNNSEGPLLFVGKILFLLDQYGLNAAWFVDVWGPVDDNHDRLS